jgi:sensor c-di-GMP phosphodiesterase-like protein
VGLALETLSYGQPLTVTALQQLYMEVQQSKRLFNDRVAQYWNNLEKHYDNVEQHQKSQEERIAEALHQEGVRRTAVEEEIVEEVTRIRTDMQEFVNK